MSVPDYLKPQKGLFVQWHWDGKLLNEWKCDGENLILTTRDKEVYKNTADFMTALRKEIQSQLRYELADEVEAELKKWCRRERYEALSPFKCSYCTAAKVAARVVRRKK